MNAKRQQDNQQVPTMQARDCDPADDSGVAPAEVVLTEQRADDRAGVEPAARLFVP